MGEKANCAARFQPLLILFWTALYVGRPWQGLQSQAIVMQVSQALVVAVLWLVIGGPYNSSQGPKDRLPDLPDHR